MSAHRSMRYFSAALISGVLASNVRPLALGRFRRTFHVKGELG